MGRLTIIDGFRGFFLLFMGVHHFNQVLSTTLGKINHHNLGWVEDAQGFVFISGLVVGLVYGRKFLRQPTVDAIYGPILARVRTIYAHQASLVLILASAALLLGSGAAVDFAPYLAEPLGFTAASLALLTASTHMGILPMYIIFLLLAPFAFRMLARGWDMPFFLVILVGWTFGQTGLSELAAAGLSQRLGVDFGFAYGFNAFAWQALFFGGFWFGFRMAEGRLDLGFLAQEQYRVAFFISLAAIAFLAGFDRIVGWNLFGQIYAHDVTAHTDRGQLAWIYPVAYLLDLFVVVWLLRVGITDRSAWIRGPGRALAWLFTRRALVFLGQHSLHVFSFHILVYYLLAQVIPPMQLSEPAATVVLVAACASLYLAAAGHAWLQARDAAKAGVAGAPVSGS